MDTWKRDRVVLPLIAGAGLIAVWAALVRLTHSTVFPTPWAVLRGLWSLARSGLLARDVARSLVRVFGAYALAVLLGVPAGIAMGRVPLLATVLNPVVQLVRPISPLAWIPVSIVLFGIGDVAIGFLIFVATVFSIVLAASSAVSAVPPIYLRVGANFGLSWAAVFWRVLVPAVLPELLNGLRVSLGIAWLVVVSAEMIAADSGLGYLIIDARNAGKRYDLVVAGMLIIGLIGFALDSLLRRLETLNSVRWGLRQDR